MSTTAAKRSRGVRVLGLAFAALFVLLCVVALIAYLGWHGKPAHWDIEQDRMASLPQAQRLAISESLRNRLLTQWSGSGDQNPFNGSDPFGQRTMITIPFDELNTWIQTEGLDLLEEIDIQIPDSAPSAMIDSPGDGLLRISFEVTADDVPQVIALSFAVTIAKDGTLTSTLKQASAGRLPLPVGTAIDLVASQAKDGMLLDLMRGNPLPPIELPIDPGEDGLRDGRLVGLEVTEDALVITRETIRRKKAD